MDWLWALLVVAGGNVVLVALLIAMAIITRRLSGHTPGGPVPEE